MLDLIIKNGLIIDGAGGPARTGDIGVKGDEITAVGKLAGENAKKIIDAQGAAVSPGFIDIQNHSDSYWTLFDYPHQESMLMQGITTIVVGQCGASLAPLPSAEALKSVQKWHSLSGVNYNWQYFDELLDELVRCDLGVNVASLVGHSTIRRGLIGDIVRRPTPQEIKVFERLLSSSLKQGAFGISMGLVYAHELDSDRTELDLLVKLAARSKRMLSVHLRSEESRVLDALDEMTGLVAGSDVRLKISHLKVRGHANWHLFKEMVAKIEMAHSRGVMISFDVYPYSSSWSVLYTYLPKWSYEGGREELIKRLRQPFMRKKIHDALIEQRADYSGITIATASSAPNLIGKTIGAIAASQGISVIDALLDTLVSTESEVVVFEENISPDDLLTLMKHPLSMIATNGAGFDLDIGARTHNLVHPRCFGAMPRFLNLVQAHELMSLERAVQKITSYPAEVLGITDRGVIKPGAKADIVVFDSRKLRDEGSLQNPFMPPSGIQFVAVRGKLAVSDGVLTGNNSGRVLRA